MPTKRLTMRQIRELMRLRFGDEKASNRMIARRLGIGRTTVHRLSGKDATAGLTWPLPEDLTDIVLEERLFGRAFQGSNRLGARDKAEPDWAKLAQELKRPGVNLQILHEEYRQDHPEGYGYSRFCELFRAFERKLSPVMRQHHRGRREAVRRLLRQEGRDRRSSRPERSARPNCSSACWGASQPDLRRSDLDAELAGLDRRPCPHAGVDRQIARNSWSRTI